MNICAVIVTYNRLECLKHALECYDAQTKQAGKIIVINNHSNDGTEEFLKSWEKEGENRKQVTLPENTGGSGGFYNGFSEAMKTECDWVWVSDDDAYPENDVFEKLERAYEELSKSRENISALCTAVINGEKIDTLHRRRIKVGFLQIEEIDVEKDEYNNPYFEMNSFSYVGCLVSQKALNKAGLTEEKYMIYYDDTDHSYRLSLTGPILCVTGAKIHHNVSVIYPDDIYIDWKVYYIFRNQYHFVKKNFGRFKANAIDFPRRIAYWKRKLRGRNTPTDYAYIKGIKDGKKGVVGFVEPFVPGWKLTKEDWNKGIRP